MKTNHLLLFITGLLTSTLAADTIELKSGLTYKGTVISQDDTSYLFKIQVTGSITDERRIQKDKIRSIEPDAKDASDYNTVKAQIPTPDMLTEKSYKKRIKLASAFLKKHPKSKHTKEVKTILETLEKESQLITNGGIKLNGHLISQSDIEANAYDVDARIIAIKMKRFAQSGHYRQALRKWENLQNNYPHSIAYQDTLTLVVRLLKAHETELQKNLDTMENRIKQQQAVLESLNANDRERTEQILQEKKERYESIIANEKNEIRTKWLTIDPLNKEAIDNNLNNAKSALQSISNLDPTEIKLAGPDYRGAWSALAKGDLKEADKRIKALKSLRLPAQYIDPLSEKLKAKESKQAEEEKAAKEAAAAAKAAEQQAAQEAAAAKKKNRKKKK